MCWSSLWSHGGCCTSRLLPTFQAPKKGRTFVERGAMSLSQKQNFPEKFLVDFCLYILLWKSQGHLVTLRYKRCWEMCFIRAHGLPEHQDSSRRKKNGHMLFPHTLLVARESTLSSLFTPHLLLTHLNFAVCLRRQRPVPLHWRYVWSFGELGKRRLLY